MKTLAKLTCILLLIALMIPMIASCNLGGKSNTEGETNGDVKNTNTESNTEAETGPEILYDENGYELDDIPDGLTFDDADFDILMWEEWAKQDFMISENAGNAWSEELYKRENFVEDRLDVAINIHLEKGSWNFRKDFIQKVENDMTSNDKSAYDLIGSYGASIGGITTKGFTANLYDINYLNFDKPWWSMDQIENATINNKIYFVTGDITPTSIMTMHCVYGNEQLLTSYGYSGFYDWVYDGEWTVEKMKETALNNVEYGEGKSDVLGLTICASAQGPLLHASGVNYLEHDEKGLLTISEDLNDQKVHNLFATLQGIYNTDNVIGQTNNSQFAAKKAFFHIGAVGDMITFANSSGFEFVVLPLPKYNTDQKDYHTTCGAWNTYYTITSKVENPDMSGAVMEALASAAHRMVTPVVFEECFSARFVADPEDAAMVQFIYDALTYDCSHVYADDAVGTLHAAFNDVMSATASWTDIYNSHIDSWKSKIMILNNNLK